MYEYTDENDTRYDRALKVVILVFLLLFAMLGIAIDAARSRISR